MLRSAPLRLMLAFALMASAGCGKKTPKSVRDALAEDELLVRLSSREVPNPAQARLSVKIRSKPLGIAAPPLGGGLVVERPSRAYVAILAPVGGPVLEIASDGERVVLLNRRDKQFVAQDAAEEALAAVTEGAVELDDLAAMLMGVLPVDAADVVAKEEADDGTLFRFEAPGGMVADAVVDPFTGTPRRIEVRTGDGVIAVVGTYEPFEKLDGEGPLLPTRMTLLVPSIDLTIDVRYKTWKALETAPDVFAPTPPEGFEVMPFDDFIKQSGESFGGGAAGDDAEETTSEEPASAE